MKKFIKFFAIRLYPLIKPFRYLLDQNSKGVKIIVIHKNKCLLIENTYRNGWTFPGGGVKKNENFKKAAERELREEVGISVLNLKKQGKFALDNKGQNKFVVFSCKVKTFHLKINDLEINQAIWVKTDEIHQSHLLPVAEKCVQITKLFSQKPLL